MIAPIRWLNLAAVAVSLALTPACGERDSAPEAGADSRPAPPPRRAAPPDSRAGTPAAPLRQHHETPPIPANPPAESDHAVSSDDESEQIPDEILHDWLQRAGRDPEGTLREALAVEDRLTRETLAEWILAAWTAEDRTEAVDWAGRYLNQPEPPAAEIVLAELLPSWAAESPQPALSWVRNRLPDSWRETGEALVAAGWAATDTRTLARWLDDQNPEEIPAIWWEELVHGLIPGEPAHAYERAAMLATPAEADEMREVVLRSWLLDDPESLDEWLESRPELAATVAALRAEIDQE